MDNIKINLSSPDLNDDYEPLNGFETAVEADNKKPKNKWQKILIGLAIVAAILFAVFSSSIAFSNESLLKNLAKLNPMDSVGKLISGTDKKLQGEENDRVNVLVMGIGGLNHDGGTLADTIILGSLKPSTNQAALMSIPRDLSIKTTDRGWMKINAVSAWAEKAKPGSGGPALQSELNTLLDTTIPYYLVIDFDGFEKLIDDFGGVDVTVENDLTDYAYPIRGRENAEPYSSRYEVLRIKKGPQHMDGATALKYARSRHALGAEGSDFARSKRQQIIITALKDKVFSLQTLVSPGRLTSLFDAYKQDIQTNMQIWEIVRLATLAMKVDKSQIINHGLSNGLDGLLYASMINGAYVLLPDDKTFNDVKNLWAYIFYADKQVSHTKTHPDDYDAMRQAALKAQASSTKSTTTATSTESINPEDVNLNSPDNPSLNTTTADKTTTTTTAPKIETPAKTAITTAKLSDLSTPNNYQTEGARIEIQNGTTILGLAGLEKKKLTDQGFTVIKTSNATVQTYTTTRAYDLSGGKYQATSAALADIYGPLATKKPAGVVSSANFLIILGQ